MEEISSSSRSVSTSHARLPTPTRLRGRLIELVPLDSSVHTVPLFEETGGPERATLWRYLFDGPFHDLAAFESYIARKAASQDPLVFALIDISTGKPAGHAAYMRMEPAHRVLEVGSILFGPSLQKSAAATEGMYLMARHAFETLGYRRYEWKCNALNEPSKRAAERLGFRFEGVFRHHMIVKGQNRDTAWYSMLDDEWPRCKEALERWLDPSNFDSAGQQRRSLASLRNDL